MVTVSRKRSPEVSVLHDSSKVPSPISCRDGLYRHRRRRQGKNRTGSLSVVGKTPPCASSEVCPAAPLDFFFFLPPEMPIPIPQASSFKPKPRSLSRDLVGSLSPRAHETLILALRRGNMSELDQPRSAQTCVVSITTLSRSHLFLSLSSLRLERYRYERENTVGTAIRVGM